MGQIVKKKKKGRPSKTDPGSRDPPQTERDVRRSLRRRSVKYVFDLDDYFDEDDLFVDDEDQWRREKKLKHLLKLQEGGDSESTAPRDRRVQHAPAASSSDEEDGGKPSKKRKLHGEMYGDIDDGNDEANEEENYNDEDEEEVRETRPELKEEDSPPGTPTGVLCGLPLPDKKSLELILDKLQRKDIYGVYAEPVDTEELPDYLDVIDHPMDFATVRNNLRNGLYATFEQFESDVFLICSNAMQYNAPDTIYHKQARNIQELAKRKFQKVRLNFERNDKENKPEQKTRSGSLSKKQIKRPTNRTGPEPVGSDFSSGATLATAGDIQNVASALQAVDGSEKTGGTDAHFDSSSFLNDNNLDRVEYSLPEHPGKRMGRATQSRFGRRSSIIQDENRRATYNLSLSQPVASSESIFSTFDDEPKQLMPVGLYSDNSYARSLSRFAATLGSVAWKVASKRIEQALPLGFKFGQGWVGDYEPLPTPVLMLENCRVKEPPFFAKVKHVVEQPRNFAKVIPGNLPFFDQKLPFLGHAGIRSPAPITTTQQIRGSTSETKSSFFLSPGVRPSASHNLSYINQNLQSTDLLLESDIKVQKQVELNSPRTLTKISADSVGKRQHPRSSEVEKNINFSKSGTFKQHDQSNGVNFGGLPNGKVVGSKVDGNTVPSSSTSADPAKPASFYLNEPGQGLSDPVQMMRMMADHNQQKSSNRSSSNAPPQVLACNDPNNAAMAAARAWMSVGAVGLRPAATENANPNKNQIYGDPLYNPSRNIHSQVPQIRGEFPSKNSGPMHAFVPQGQIPMLVGNQIQLQNQRMAFPQLAPADLSRFQMQSSWRNVSPQMQMQMQMQMHSRQKQESLPPDLNIGYQSSDSPKRLSSGVLVDSQQPDLALQL